MKCCAVDHNDHKCKYLRDFSTDNFSEKLEKFHSKLHVSSSLTLLTIENHKLDRAREDFIEHVSSKELHIATTYHRIQTRLDEKCNEHRKHLQRIECTVISAFKSVQQEMQSWLLTAQTFLSYYDQVLISGSRRVVVLSVNDLMKKAKNLIEGFTLLDDRPYDIPGGFVLAETSPAMFAFLEDVPELNDTEGKNVA